MKNDIKNNELRERQGYVPASVKVIQLQTSQRILNDSDPTETTPEQTVF